MTQRTFRDFTTAYAGSIGDKDIATERLERHAAPALVPAIPAVPGDPLIGMLLRLDRTCDRRFGCCERTGAIHPGTGPHRYALRCDECGRHRGWLPARAAAVLAVLYRDGKLSALPTLFDRSIRP